MFVVAERPSKLRPQESFISLFTGSLIWFWQNSLPDLTERKLAPPSSFVSPESARLFIQHCYKNFFYAKKCVGGLFWVRQKVRGFSLNGKKMSLRNVKLAGFSKEALLKGKAQYC
jgi:hypothetical protein